MGKYLFKVNKIDNTDTKIILKDVSASVFSRFCVYSFQVSLLLTLNFEMEQRKPVLSLSFMVSDRVTGVSHINFCRHCVMMT